MTPSGTLTPASTATQDEDDCILLGLEEVEELPTPLFSKNPAPGITVPCANLKGWSYLQRTEPLSATTLLQQYSVSVKL